MQPSNFTFTEDGHRYTLDGRVLPSVSKILEEWVKVDLGSFAVYVNIRTGQHIPAEIWEAAQDRGTAVHAVFFLCLTGQGVDESALDPDLFVYLRRIEKWIDIYKPRVILAETPLLHPSLLYAGRLDCFAECKGIKRPVLLDGKSGMRGPVGPQTAAYEALVRVETGFKGLIDRYVLDLSDKDSFEPCGKPTDFTLFILRLNLYKMERRNHV